MDIKLKGALDGVEVAAALYQHLHIPVVYLTAHADAEILERAKKTAPAGYVLKPFDDRALRTAIELALEQHHRERHLIESGQHLATAISSIDEAVIVTQQNGRIALMNRLAETLTGWRQEDALGRSVGDIFTTLNAETGSLQPSPTGRVLREGISIGLGEHALLLGKHGRNTLIQGSATPVQDGQREAAGACLLFRAAGQPARDENWGAAEHGSGSRLRLLGRLTAGVAQQFTSLLSTGRGRARAALLANRLLAFGQRRPAAPVAFDLNELIAGLEDLLRCALGEAVELRLALGSRTGSVKADPGQIELLLMHLALSACDGAAGGAFSIETDAYAGNDPDDSYTVLTVSPLGADNNPALDEILQQAGGEIRIVSEDGEVQIYLPKISAGAPVPSLQ